MERRNVIRRTSGYVVFCSWIKKVSPVTHKVVYQVTDSIGNITEESCSVKIKYNEFPVIEAQDRYFTLQEAQQGAITEEVLKTQAISEGKVKANDTEEGDLSEKIETA